MHRHFAKIVDFTVISYDFRPMLTQPSGLEESFLKRLEKSERHNAVQPCGLRGLHELHASN